MEQTDHRAASAPQGHWPGSDPLVYVQANTGVPMAISGGISPVNLVACQAFAVT